MDESLAIILRHVETILRKKSTQRQAEPRDGKRKVSDISGCTGSSMLEASSCLG